MKLNIPTVQGVLQKGRTLWKRKGEKKKEKEGKETGWLLKLSQENEQSEFLRL